MFPPSPKRAVQVQLNIRSARRIANPASSEDEEAEEDHTTDLFRSTLGECEPQTNAQAACQQLARWGLWSLGDLSADFAEEAVSTNMNVRRNQHKSNNSLFFCPK